MVADVGTNPTSAGEVVLVAASPRLSPLLLSSLNNSLSHQLVALRAQVHHLGARHGGGQDGLEGGCTARERGSERVRER